MQFYEFGKKNTRTVMFIHGNLMTWRQFSDIYPLLENEYHVIIVGLDGFDEKENTTYPGFEEEANRLSTYIKEELDGKEDVRRAVRIGACNIYHMCGHNMVHEKSVEILKALYKSAAFTVQAVYYDQTGTYIKQKAELITALQPQEREILQTGIMLIKQSNMAQTEFERLSKLLFSWAAGLIIRYKIK